MKRYVALLLAALVISCGGPDGGGGGTSGGSTPPPIGGGDGGGGDGGGGDGGGGDGGGGNTGPSAPAGSRVEESDTTVLTLSSGWTAADARWGWSGGAAVQTNVVGATATLSFTGTSVRWIGLRGRAMGRALVRIDGGSAREVSSYLNTGDVARTPIVTIQDLSAGRHTLTIEVLSGVVAIDAFDIQPSTTVSHWQDTDPKASFSAGWTKASTANPWSGNGAANAPELPVTAQETYTAGETLTLPFRGTSISWIGYRGPDGGIATVQVDGGEPVQVDTYSPTIKYQAVVFTASGLADANHTLTITATGQRNEASSAPRIVVDAFDVMTPGKRFQQDHPSVTYSANAHWNRAHNSRVWSEGVASTSNINGATVTFRFNGTSVSIIGCRKSSAGGIINVYIDGVLIREVRLRESYPIEGYQVPVFRQDGLAPGDHTLVVEITSINDGPYVVIDAFDVHP
jgi:hypothetical protein